MHSYDYLVFIGRFQQFHNGHYEVLQRALRLSKKVIIVFGSARRPRSIKDPWTVAERGVMVSACAPEATAEGRVLFASVVDRLYNDQQWAGGVQAAVTETIAGDAGDAAPRVGLIGPQQRPQQLLSQNVSAVGIGRGAQSRRPLRDRHPPLRL